MQSESTAAATIKLQFDDLYRELKHVARRQLAVSDMVTLNTTALVHEVFLKLVPARDLHLADQSHFFALAAKAMRQVVVDYARARITEKRGGKDRQSVTLEHAGGVVDPALGPEQLLRLHLALGELGEQDPALVELVELRFFAGLSMQQIARLQKVGARTLDRDWRRAKAYLFTALRADEI